MSSSNNQNYSSLPQMDLPPQDYQQRDSDNLDFLDDLSQVAEIHHYPVVTVDDPSTTGCEQLQYLPGPSMNNNYHSSTTHTFITADTTINNQGQHHRDTMPGTTGVPMNTTGSNDTESVASSFSNVDMTPKIVPRTDEAEVFPAEVGPSKAIKVPKICNVCGDRAKSLHFGGLSCDSCKAFFRRAVQQDNAFRCGYNNSCPITILTRKTCQSCRFHKCLKIGMEKKWVMSDQDRVTFQKQRLEKKQQQEKKNPETEVTVEPPKIVQHEPKPKDNSSSSTTTASSYEPQVSQMLTYMTAQEQAEIESLVHKFHQSYIDIPYRVSHCPKNRNSLEVIDMFTTILRRMVYFHKRMSDFNQLTPLDQSTLLRQGVLEMCMLRSALTYDFTNNQWPKKTGNMEFLKHCPTLHIEDMRKLVTPDLYNLQMSFIAGMQELQTDEPIVVLLTLIVLFYPDRTGLEDLETVSRIQDKYLGLLKNYTHWRFGPNGSKIYAKLLTKLSDLRQLNDSHNQYTLRLDKNQINQIQTQMSKINLNPYTQWDLVKCDEDKVVGHVTPVSKSNPLSTPSEVEQTTTEKNSTNFESPRQVAKKRLIPSTQSTNLTPIIPPPPSRPAASATATHPSVPPPVSSESSSAMVRDFFNQMVNRQIPIFLENPMATVSNDNEMEGVSKYFAAIGGARLPTLSGRGDGNIENIIQQGLAKFPNIADLGSMMSQFQNSSSIMDAYRQHQQQQHPVPVEVNQSAYTVKPQFSLPPHYLGHDTMDHHQLNQNSLLYNEDSLINQYAKKSGLDSQVLKQQIQQRMLDGDHPTISGNAAATTNISYDPTLSLATPSGSFNMADQPSSDTLGTFHSGQHHHYHHHQPSSSVEPIQYSATDMNKLSYNDLQDKNKLEEQYYDNSSIGMPSFSVSGHHATRNESAVASSYQPSASDTYYLDGNVNPIYAMNSGPPQEENATIGHHGQQQHEGLYARFLDQHQVHNYFDYEQQNRQVDNNFEKN